MVEADSLFVACPRCSAWPMAANVTVLDWRTDSEVRFRCPRCDHQVTAPRPPSRSKDQGMRNLKRPWTTEDDVRLRSLLEAGVSVLLVAAKLKRTTSAIKSRSRHLAHHTPANRPQNGIPLPNLRTEKAHQDTKQMLEPTPELPDDTRISQVQFPTCILNALAAAGLRTVGKVREASDKMLLSLPDFGRGSVAHLRETLGLPSTDGVRPGLNAKGK